MRAAACARVRCSVQDGVPARRHTADASRARRQSHLTASPVYESNEGGEERAYDDRMSLEHLRATACACKPSIRSQLRAGGGKLILASLAVLALAPHSAVGADGGAPAVHADAPHSVVLADGGAPAVACLLHEFLG